ncbi:IS3 family transposase [Spiroplasma endosymbiont of Notiophilus biguttatus]|uniref:IS3 family transposase n=1 Tax=Spiroplasma endosymbiont of Notiophilus biguttatus TaxID=3066285 RepID=UPI00313B2AF9
MNYKVYSKETKLAVVNEYLVDKKLKIHEIQVKYKLSTPVLIYNWVNQYQIKGENAFTKISKSQTSHRIDKKDIEIKLLNKEIDKFRKQALKDEVEKELLKEQLACEKKLTRGKNSKLLKYKCFLIVEKYKQKGHQLNKIIVYIAISKTAYYLWVKKGKKQYQSKINDNLIQAINKIVLIKNEKKYINITSFEKVRLELKIKNKGLKCSKTSIKQILKDNNIKLLLEPKSTNRVVENSDLKNNKDLLKRNFSSNNFLEKVSMDGTWFKNIIIGDKKTKLLVVFATDMYSNSIVGWKINKSENAKTVLNVVNQIELASAKQCNFTTIQSDLGSANTSEIVSKVFNTSTNLIHSKSLSGFKGNQVSECLNRWIKRDFKMMFGSTFESMESFNKILEKFVRYWNNDRIVIRLKMPPNQFVQIWRQESKLI